MNCTEELILVISHIFASWHFPGVCSHNNKSAAVSANQQPPFPTGLITASNNGGGGNGGNSVNSSDDIGSDDNDGNDSSDVNDGNDGNNNCDGGKGGSSDINEKCGCHCCCMR